MSPARQWYWLVKTGIGSSEVQATPAGQSPPGAKFAPGRAGYPNGSAVYVGATPAETNRWVPVAAARLGVPNPHNVPSLGTSLGIVGAELGGFGLGALAARSVAAADEAGVAATAGGTAATAGRTRPETPGSASAPGLGSIGKAGLFGSIAAGIGSTTDFLKWIAWLFHPRNVLRAVEFLVGMVVMGFGLQASTQAFKEQRGGGRRAGSTVARSGLGRAASRVLGASPPARVARGRQAHSRGREQARREQRGREHKREFQRGKRTQETRQGRRQSRREGRKVRREDIPF